MTLGAYFGEGGDHQRIRWTGGSTVDVLVDSAASAGQLTILRRYAVLGDAVPVHVHNHEDEVFLVLEGTVTVWVGNDRRDLAEGGVCLLPRRLPHAYLVTSETASVLNVCTPGGLEAAFREAGWILTTPAPEGWAVAPAAMAEAFAKVDCEILGPPRAADDGPILASPASRERQPEP